ncbi:MAG TPA: hypothetical protein VGN17_00140 [Bryobacteraceae bacterium]|jgi:hypothetical protein
MKKTLAFAALLASSFVARAESIHVHFATAFPATSAYLPAGDYTVSPVSSSASVLLIEGQGLHAFVFGRIVKETPYEKTSVELEKGKPDGKPAGVLNLRSATK